MDVLQRWLQKELTFLKGTLFALTLTHTQFFYFNTFRVNVSFDFDKWKIPLISFFTYTF